MWSTWKSASTNQNWRLLFWHVLKSWWFAALCIQYEMCDHHESLRVQTKILHCFCWHILYSFLFVMAQSVCSVKCPTNRKVYQIKKQNPVTNIWLWKAIVLISSAYVRKANLWCMCCFKDFSGSLWRCVLLPSMFQVQILLKLNMYTC